MAALTLGGELCEALVTAAIARPSLSSPYLFIAGAPLCLSARGLNIPLRPLDLSDEPPIIAIRITNKRQECRP